MTEEAAYRAAFERYLCNALELSKLDSEIATSYEGVRPMADPERSAYFLKSALDLNFICLRNDVFLSNLDACDAEELARCIKDDDSHALDAIVRKTWRKAIEARIDGVEGIFDLTYYPDGTSAPNNSVVFEVAAQVLDYDDSGALITSGEEARCREAAISSVLESHIEEYSALLGAPVVFFFDC